MWIDPSSQMRATLSRSSGNCRGSPYGASPITLYSPELTLKPVKYVSAL